MSLGAMNNNKISRTYVRQMQRVCDIAVAARLAEIEHERLKNNPKAMNAQVQASWDERYARLRDLERVVDEFIKIQEAGRKS